MTRASKVLRLDSIAARVTALAAVGGGILLLGGGLLLHAQLRAATQAQFHDELIRDATALAIFRDSGNPAALKAPPYDQPFSGAYWTFRTQDGLSGSSPSLAGFELAEHANAPSPRGDNQITPGPLDEPLRSVTVSLQDGGTLTLARDATDSLALIRTLGQRLAIGLALIWLILTAAISRLAWQGLADVRSLTAAVDKLASGASQRIPEDQPRELRSLAAQLNQLVAAHRGRIERQRRATTQLAHALKTPLTVLRAAVERAQDAQATPPERGDPQAKADSLAPPGLAGAPMETGALVPVEQIRSSVDRMLPLVEEELARARIHGPMPGLGATDVASQLSRAVSLCKVDHGLQDSDFWLDADHADVLIESGDLLTVLWNLIDNAGKHGGPPVRVIARNDYISVEDAGSRDSTGGTKLTNDTAKDAQMNRTDHPARDDAPSGNGVRLVADIADAYGWRVTVGASPLGGRRTLLTAPQQHPDDVPVPSTSLTAASQALSSPA